MSLISQNRLQKAFSELSTPLKFQAWVKSYVKNGRSDKLISDSIKKEDFPLIKTLLKKYLELPFLYYERLSLNQKLQVFDNREAWQVQTEMSLGALRIALKYIDSLDRLNFYTAKNKYLNAHCKETREQVKELIRLTEKVVNSFSKNLFCREEAKSLLEEVQTSIDKVEDEIGFSYPHKDNFC